MSALRRMPSKFLDGTPLNVIDIFYNPKYTDCYSVWVDGGMDGWLMCFGSNGDATFSGWSEYPSRTLKGYRDRARRYRIAWTDLPDAIKAIVMFDTNVLSLSDDLTDATI